MRVVQHRAAGNQILMCGKAARTLRLEHMIGEHVLLCERPIWADLPRIDILIDVAAGYAIDVDLIEPVHSAVVPIANPIRVAVVRRNMIFEVGFRERNFRSVVRVSERRSVARPGNVAKRLSYVRFSWMRMTMCVKYFPALAGGKIWQRTGGRRSAAVTAAAQPVKKAREQGERCGEGPAYPEMLHTDGITRFARFSCPWPGTLCSVR